MRTTSVGYGQHPRRTAMLVALVVASLTATTTGTGLVLAGPASAQPSTAAGAMARAAPRTAALGSARAVARSAPGASSSGPGP